MTNDPAAANDRASPPPPRRRTIGGAVAAAGVPASPSSSQHSTQQNEYKRTVSREDHFTNYKRHSTIDWVICKSMTTATSSSASDSDDLLKGSRLGASARTIWSRLLQGDRDGATWENGHEVPPQQVVYKSGAGVTCSGALYELKHFLAAVRAHPARILLPSLAVAALVAGAGLAALTSQRDAYASERRNAARFIAEESAAHFRGEFKRAFVPLYALRAAAQHSGHFDDLAARIGNHPHLLKDTDVEVPGEPGGLGNLRDVGGICDGEDVLRRWEDLLDASTRENDLEGLIVRYRLLPKNVACLDYKGGKANVDSGMDMSNSNHPFWKMVVEDLFVKVWKGLHVFGPFLFNGKEMFCTHLAIWNDDPNARDWVTDGGEIALDEITEDFIDVHGKEVEAWGFVMNYLDWGEMKRRSGMHERFADVGMDFYLARREEDMDPNMPDYAHLASSENSHLLNDENSVVVETESLHGIWENRVGITSVNGWNPEWYGPAVTCLVIVSILLGMLTASTLVKSQLHRDLVNSMIPKKAIKKLQRNQPFIEKFNLITVFYCDIVDYSGASGSWHDDSVQVMNLLNDLFCELDKIAERHGVYRVATTGNRYMVVGGAMEPESARNAATRVALFALDVAACVDNKFSTEEGERLFVRSGIASNPAVAGCVGRELPRYCFFGDAVDVASRMEKTSERMKIQCSEVTYRLLQDSKLKFILTKRADGGAGVPQDTYWVEKASPCENCFRPTQGSYILEPCGHILCAGCNNTYNLNVCPTCRSKVEARAKWTGKDYVDAENGECDNGSCIFQCPAT